MNEILIFAGTFEGRMLCEYLYANNINISVCVATEYGKDILPNMKVHNKRLDENEMVDFISSNKFGLVIDATHPYATEVTKNILKACEKTNSQYIRLLRDEGQYESLINFENTMAAVEFIKNTQGNILVTTGSKELSLFLNIPDYEKRIFARVLPSLEVIENCTKMGIKGRNLVCMQGPFSHSMNVAMLRQFDCKYLVTKNTGSVGGLDEKISACVETGTKVIMIDRPTKEVGYSFSEVVEICQNYNGCDVNTNDPKNSNIETYINKKEFFPLFVQTKNKNVLVVGGGEIATRRVKTLLKFNFNITVVAPLASDEIISLSKQDKLIYLQREFEKADLSDKYMVISATNDRYINNLVGEIARKQGVLVNTSDRKEECDFYFPGIITNDNIVVGLTSEGKSHKLVKDVSNKIRVVLDSEN